MDTERICPSCQKPLAPDVPLGLCPECLIKSGFPTGVESAGAKQPPFIPPPVEELAKLFPQLEILELIGKGGMGAVYKARQPRLNRFVALKILPPSIGSDPAFAERFAREAQALARLNHPGIVILYEFGQAGGLHFFMMEYVDGVNLRQLLVNGRIAPREALAIVPQICDALQFAHDQGIVHRDIKPENILLDRRGRVKVADFGLAKIIGGANEPVPHAYGTGAPLLTETGKIIGTPQYMSPEQIAHPAEVDHRADIYALGVVFYQMLTGELPEKKIEAPSKKVHIDVRLDEVVLRALEKKPELRYQQASAMKTQLETIAGTEPVQPDSQPTALNERRAPSACWNWATWSPFASPEVREIVAHMTKTEKRDVATRGALFGIWNAATCFAPVFILFFAPAPFNNWKLALAVCGVGFAFYPVWYKMLWELHCSTEWARARGIKPESLRKFSFTRQNIGKALVFYATIMLMALGPRLLSRREPVGVWFPDRINNSIREPYGEAAIRVTDVTNRGQVVLVKLACETGRSADNHELLVRFTGPVFDYRADIAAEVTNLDCLISPALMTVGGKVLAGSSHLQDASAHLIGFVLPDEATAAKVVEQVRQTHLGKPRGLTEQWSQFLLFLLHRRVGEDAKGKPVDEGLTGELSWMLKDATTTQTKTNPFRDTAKYLSPFTMVHFDTNDINKVVVAYNDSEYELAAIDDLSVTEILDFCRHQYGQPPFGEGWAQKRFAEDLVIVLSEMKHPVGSDNTVSLTLVDPQTGQQKIIAHAPMTGKNRAAIFQDRTLDNSNLLQSLPQK